MEGLTLIYFSQNPRPWTNFWNFFKKYGATANVNAAFRGIIKVHFVEKGKSNVNSTFSFSFSFFHFLIFLFSKCKGWKNSSLYVQEGHEQIVQILLEKGKPNVNLATKVILLIVSFSFSFFFSLSHFSSLFHLNFFYFFLISKGWSNSSFMLLLKMDMNKLFKFYWKKENQMLILQGRFLLLFDYFS